MRILVSAQWSGGIGGLERNLNRLVATLSEHEVVLCAEQVIPSVFTPSGAHLTVLPKWRWRDRFHRPWLFWWPLAVTAQRAFEQPFDVYIHYRNGPDLTRRFDSKLKLLSPSGVADAELESRFDLVLAQSAAASFVNDPSKTVIMPPPTAFATDVVEPVPDLPEAFVLTVFNPYGEIKGHDVLYEVIDASPHPLVWCHSNATWDSSSNVRAHPNIIHLEDATQPQIRYLYDRCRAYVCFSRSEGYGWGIADALLAMKPIVSRRVGVLNSYPTDEPGLELYDDAAGLRRILAADSYTAPAYDVDRLSPERWLENLETLVAAGPSERAAVVEAINDRARALADR